jgi:hypothetical protein
MFSQFRSKAIAVGSALILSGLGLPAAQAADYEPDPSAITCEARAVQNASRIRVNMGPNLDGNANYSFRIQRKTSSGWERVLGKFQTRGDTEVRTINVSAGRYRARCYNEAGTDIEATSNTVRIRR